MPFLIKVHKISKSWVSKKSIDRKIRKIDMGKIVHNGKDINESTLTFHAQDRRAERCGISMDDMKIDIYSGIPNAAYCTIHKDYRVIGLKYTYHFGEDGQIITIYKSDKKLRMKHRKYHERLPMEARNLIGILGKSSKTLQL